MKIRLPNPDEIPGNIVMGPGFVAFKPIRMKLLAQAVYNIQHNQYNISQIYSMASYQVLAYSLAGKQWVGAFEPRLS